MSDKYILDGHMGVPCDDLLEWAKWYEKAERQVAETMVGDKRVSTVFLGIDHQWGDGPPMLFETMIFGVDNYSDCEYCEWCSTWEQAEEMHKVALATLGYAQGESRNG